MSNPFLICKITVRLGTCKLKRYRSFINCRVLGKGKLLFSLAGLISHGGTFSSMTHPNRSHAASWHSRDPRKICSPQASPSPKHHSFDKKCVHQMGFVIKKGMEKPEIDSKTTSPLAACRPDWVNASCQKRSRKGHLEGCILKDMGRGSLE